jgi:DNA replication protein DnaC
MTTSEQELKDRAHRLGLYGLLANWDEATGAPVTVETYVGWEDVERQRRSLERRMTMARLGRFKPIADFDWSWPKVCDREAVQDLLDLKFMTDSANGVLVGPNGTGKSMIARNVAYAAVMAGHNVRFVTASQMLNELAAQDGAIALQRKLKAYSSQQLLVIDELGYLSYGNRHADLLFEVVSRRYNRHSTLITTNKPFGEWHEVFPNASCVVTLIDRLIHRCDVISIEGESYRLKEARERTSRIKADRKSAKKSVPSN